MSISWGIAAENRFDRSIFYDIIINATGDDWLRRKRLGPDCEPSGADLANSAQPKSANRTNLSTLPLAA